jgi:nucleoside-diphosphate-sugar epimerase
MRRAFIIGCGYTGGALAHRLLSAGIPVAGTNASGAPGSDPALARFDLLDPRPPDLRAAEDAVVYYMVPTLAREYHGAAGPHMPPLRAALDALRPHAIAGLIYLSSTSVYGDKDGAWVDEETPPAPHSPWGRMRLDLEETVMAYGADRDVPACVVRLPEIYGPGRGPAARLRQGYRLRFPERYSNRIHREDLADVLLDLGRRLDRPLLLAADDCPARAQDVYAFAARLLGLGEVSVAREETADPNRIALLRDSKRCSNARLREWMGRPLRYPSYREGIPTTIDSKE